MLRLVATCLFLFTTTLTYAAPAIDWWVKHPFRYFTETTDFDMQREAMAEVMTTHGGAFTATAVSDLERLLNDPRWLREWYKQDATLYPNPRGRADLNAAGPILSIFAAPPVGTAANSGTRPVPATVSERRFVPTMCARKATPLSSV